MDLSVLADHHKSIASGGTPGMNRKRFRESFGKKEWESGLGQAIGPQYLKMNNWLIGKFSQVQEFSGYSLPQITRMLENVLECWFLYIRMYYIEYRYHEIPVIDYP